MTDVLLEARNLEKVYPPRHRWAAGKSHGYRAIDGVDLDVFRGETLGLVGESGCGKSTLARSLVRLHDVTSGRITFDGRDITTLSARDMRPIRQDLQIIFQDPYSSLNPRRRVGSIIADPLRVQGVGNPSSRRRRVAEVLDLVGLSSEHAHRFPGEFSGGQRQRIGIARALTLEPKLIVCDEPVSALDVSIQAQILNLLVQLQDSLNLTYVFISHDMAVVHHMSDRIAVMSQGKIVEIGDADQVVDHPQHPYSRELMLSSRLSTDFGNDTGRERSSS